MGPNESHCMRIFREYSPILVNGPTILHVCNHFSIHSNKKIMPVFRDFPLFVKLDLTLNKLPRQAGMSMPSAPHLCQELLVNWTGESIRLYILIYMVRTIHVGMMVCELKMSIYHIYIQSLLFQLFDDGRIDVKNNGLNLSCGIGKGGQLTFPFATSQDS